MALALYRKYRPRTFTEVIGQEHVTEPLMQALRTGRLHHAYLFSGPRGCGKTSSARILARSLNCEKGPTPEPCGECESCVALAPDGPGSIDVIEIDAASHGGVDDARDLRERAFFAPVASRFKVYVIDEAHMVSAQGFNALLKLVEEPPEYVKFVFATTEPEKVLGTIKSRTHHYPFRLIPPSVLRPYLEKLCREEGVTVEPAVLPLVVRAGAGSARDSLSVLDQLIAGAGSSGVTYARAVALLGVTDVALIDEMVDALAAGDGAAAFATIDRVADAGHDPRRFASDLLERFRDLIILQQVPEAAASGIIEAPEDQLERMTAQAARVGQATLSRYADIAHNGLTEMRGTTAPRLLLELIVARMLLPGADESHGALLQRLERMERRLGAAEVGELPVPTGGRPPVPAPAVDVAPAQSRPASVAPDRNTDRGSDRGPAPAESASETARKPAQQAPAQQGPAQQAPAQQGPAQQGPAQQGPATPAQATEPGSLDAAAVRRMWDEVLAIAGRKSRRLAAIARDGVVRDLDGNTVVLLFKSPFHANSVRDNPEPLVEALHEMLGGGWQIRVELGGEQDRRSENRPVQASPVKAAGPAADGGDGPDETDWPTPAQPGGGAAAPSPPPERDRPSRTRPGPAEARGRATKAAKRTGAQRTDSGSANRTAAPPSAPAYEGFDPGDEPVDDLVEPVTRQTSHDQALRTITATFEAETLGDTEAG